MEPQTELKETEAQPEGGRPTNVWRGTPRVWERCVFCELKRECTSAGVTRGSRACTDARYAMVKR